MVLFGVVVVVVLVVVVVVAVVAVAAAAAAAVFVVIIVVVVVVVVIAPVLVNFVLDYLTLLFPIWYSCESKPKVFRIPGNSALMSCGALGNSMLNLLRNS